MKTTTKLLPMITLVFLTSCSRMHHTEQNVLGGAVLGALGGIAIAAIVGHGINAGALVGAGVGAMGGYFYDQLTFDDSDYY